MALTSTITGGAAPIIPDGGITQYSSKRATNNIVHDVLGSPAPAVSLADAANRSGQLVLVFLTQAGSIAAENALKAGVIFTLTETVATSTNMTFIISGDLARELDVDSYTWQITLDFQEVT